MTRFAPPLAALSLIAAFLGGVRPAYSAAGVRHAPGEILVRFRNATGETAAKIATDLAADFGLRSIDPVFPPSAGLSKPTGSFGKPNALLGQVYRITYDTDAGPTQVASTFAQRPDVLYAVPNHLFRPLAVPDDPRLPDQTNLQRIHWQELWDGLGPKQQDVTVAIIDSGVDIDHVDLRGRIWVNRAESAGAPGVDDDGNGYVDDIRGWDFSDAPTLPGKGDYLTPDNDPSDESGHGTLVAGVVGAETNNGTGVAGVAPDCILMALRAGVTTQAGDTFLEEDDLAAAIVYAVDNGARILNMSWGSEELAYVIRDALAYAHARGAVLVVAAGNSGEVGLSHPAALDVTIAVGSTDNSDRRSGFSSQGVPLDLVAPGSSVLSTSPGDFYSRRSGTSFAAPHVSGLAALVLSRVPELTAEQVRGLLTRSVSDLGVLGWDQDFGAGLVDGTRLLTNIHAGQDVAVVAIDSPQTGAGFDGPADIRARAAGGGLISYELSWGVGQTPDRWTQLQTGPASSDIDAVWQADTPSDTTAVIRLAGVLDDGSLLEDRVLISFGPAAPVIKSHSITPVLDGDRILYQVRWSTDLPSSGQVAFGPAGSGGDTLASPVLHTQHAVILPADMPGGTIEYHVIATGPSGRSSRSAPVGHTVRQIRVPAEGYTRVATLPDGFLADRPADFDGDGLPEVVLMPYVPGTTFSAPESYERAADGSFESIYTWRGAYLPWSVGDVDGDGEPDLMATEVARLRVFHNLMGSTHPQDELFDFPSTWGGEIADLDGDGSVEIVARSGSQNGYEVIGYQQDQWMVSTFLANPTGGAGNVGPRPVVADLDGDGQMEILAGDADGDLWIYEQLQDLAFTSTWQSLGDDATDARWVGGGADLDGDGDVEFAVARAETDDNDALNGYWELEIYGPDDLDSFVLEWRARITGVLTSGNGIATADADGDGRADLVCCLRPDLYVIRSDAPDTYRPVWHGPVGLTHRPMVTDLDADGLPEILFNLEGNVHILERESPPPSGQGPEILSARPLGPDRASLTWMPVDDAAYYRVLRGTAGTDLAAAADRLTVTAFVDTGLTALESYVYRIVAVLMDGAERTSAASTVRPNPNPLLSQLEPLGHGQLGLTFDEPIAPLFPDAIRLGPANVRATSAVRDLEFTRLILTFPRVLNTGASYTLDLSAVADTSGAPIDPAFATVDFTPDRTIYPAAAAADFDTDGDVDFSDFLLFAPAYGGSDPAYDLDGDGAVSFPDFLLFASYFGRSV